MARSKTKLRLKRRLGLSLPVKLLFLTLAFIMLAEVLIFLPSIGREQRAYINSRLASGHLAVLALEASPTGMVDEALQEELLNHADAALVGLKRPDGSNLLLMSSNFDPSLMPVNRTIDLDQLGPFGLISAALKTLVANKTDTMIRSIGTSPKDGNHRVEILIPQSPLIEHLRVFAWRIFTLSSFISFVAATLIYFSLLGLLVRPVNRLTRSMQRFAESPETEVLDLPKRLGNDELGMAQRQLSEMQDTVRMAFRERSRLAALGTAVTKINHDLRNLLSTSLLLSDSLEASPDPTVKKVAPRLTAEIERAADMCTASLKFARNVPQEPNREVFLCLDFFDHLKERLNRQTASTATFEIDLPDGSKFNADKEQFDRIFTNLLINASQAGAGSIQISLENSTGLCMLISDDGPGLPPVAQKNLFTPFAGTTKKDGSGLGLSICKDLLQAHGCDIQLQETSAEGTVFKLTLNAQTFNT